MAKKMINTRNVSDTLMLSCILLKHPSLTTYMKESVIITLVINIIQCPINDHYLMKYEYTEVCINCEVKYSDFATF